MAANTSELTKYLTNHTKTEFALEGTGPEQAEVGFRVKAFLRGSVSKLMYPHEQKVTLLYSCIQTHRNLFQILKVFHLG